MLVSSSSRSEASVEPKAAAAPLSSATAALQRQPAAGDRADPPASADAALQRQPAAGDRAAPPPSATAALQRQPAAGDDAPLDPTTLARLTGGALEQHVGDTSTVSFLARVPDPSPPAPPAATAPSAPTGSPTASAAGSPASAAADTIAIAGEHGPLRMDELYDRILKRLRRDLLGDRERRGRAIGEGRW